jgi:type IV fimbrial biogenesis protein FimT
MPHESASEVMMIPRNAGLTLPELLLTLMILAVLSVAAVPAFTDLVLNQRMTARVNRLIHGVHLAKRAAHQFTTDVVLCKSPDGLQCDHAAPWQAGWIVFVNDGRELPPRVDPGERVLDAGAAFESGAIRANRTHFVFHPFETRSTNGTLVFCDRRGAQHARAVVVSYTGRPRSVRRGPDDEPLSCPS